MNGLSGAAVDFGQSNLKHYKARRFYEQSVKTNSAQTLII
jgi:hypothetical protein